MSSRQDRAYWDDQHPGECYKAHDNVDGEFVEHDDNGDETWQCPMCGDQWTEYKDD